ncbi:hypothetical protein [Paraburkholderia sp. J11-2]|uniref:gp53-like domain-containing protein n=1 Tax=Paraburkholderia sp. J11-2 TaxID=2805431 RepID=UPI002AB7F2C8|nr:hypothetical protein [Paraburkholderia sp. J11-2]
MTTFIFANNVNTTLAGAVSTSATTITLASTANLPTTIPSGSVLVITLNDAATRQNFEVVYATARTGATLTVLRAQEGTAALAWLTGDYAFSPPTAGQQASFGQLAEANTWTGNNGFTSPVAVANAVAAGEAVALGQFLMSLGVPGYLEIPAFAAGSPITFILQWGSGTAPASGGNTTSATVTFSQPFSNACVYASANALGGANSVGGGNPASNAHNYSKTGCTAVFDVLNFTTFNQSLSFTWFALGY